MLHNQFCNIGSTRLILHLKKRRTPSKSRAVSETRPQKRSGYAKTLASGYCGGHPMLVFYVHLNRLVLLLGGIVLANAKVTLVLPALLLETLLEAEAGTQVFSAV